MLTRERLWRLGAKALANGATCPTGQPHVLEWDISGRCEAPVPRTVSARGEVKHTRKWVASPGIMSVHLTVPCRRCPTCLRVRGAMWRKRAQVEIERAPRTWLASFTMAPEEHLRSEARVMSAIRKKGGLPKPLTDDEKFALLAGDFGRELTLWKKRVREASGFRWKKKKRVRVSPPVPSRHIFVCEKHKEELAGLPHFHALIHEVDRPITKECLQSQWHLGFSSFKLVEDDEEAAWYVAKYVAKEATVRVRASLRYGQPERPLT